MQSIIIYTHLTITPDMLHDISTQIESGKERGFTPYEWELGEGIFNDLNDTIDDLNDTIDDLNDTIDDLNDTIDDLNEDIEGLKEDIDDYKDEIKELEKLYEETYDEVHRLKDLLSDNNISYE